MMVPKQDSFSIKNKKARFDYFIYDKYEAGIALQGGEIKSIRVGKANLVDSYVRFNGKEAFVVNMHISPYTVAANKYYDPRRSRKLLLHKAEIRKLSGQVSQKGYAVVPLQLYFRKGKAKLEIALCKGKKRHDKRETLRRKAHEREIERVLRKR